MSNVINFFKSQSYWHLIASVFMLFALLVSLYFSHTLIDPPDFGQQLSMAWMGVVVWVYATIGLFLCYFANATGKKIMFTIGYGWSCIALLWGMMIDHCGDADLCFKDTSEHFPLLVICLGLMACVYWYETQPPPFNNTVLKRWFGLLMRLAFLAWAAYTVLCLFEL